MTTYGIDELDRAIADGEAHGMVKVLTVPGKDRILGVTIAGEHAGDLIAEFIAAMRHGLGLNKILGTIHIYPTLAEANKYAAGAWKKAHAPQRVLAWLESSTRGCAADQLLLVRSSARACAAAALRAFDHAGVGRAAEEARRARSTAARPRSCAMPAWRRTARR